MLNLFIFFILFLMCFQPQNAFSNDISSPLVTIKRTPTFEMPIDCQLGEDCWIMNYMDYQPDDGQGTDLACLNRTYDGHKGTDFAILDEEAMKAGVDVIAPRDGAVTKIRDGEPDQWSNDTQLEAIKTARKECGNAILIDHGSGLQTIYCHLKKGSIVVTPNQKVSEGQKLAQVGLSGLTQFPHLHFGIIWEGAVIDPFTGTSNTQSCDSRKQALWDRDLDIHYEPVVIQNAGFSNNAPSLAAIERDASSPDIISPDSHILAFWGTILGARVGDKITIEILDPDMKIWARREITQDKTRARQFYYTGRRLNGRVLKEGAYIGTITVSRQQDGKESVVPAQTMTKTLLVSYLN